MAFSQVLAANALVRLLRGDSARADLAVSMTGLKLGDRLLVLGLSEPVLLSALGGKVGITGRACGGDASPEAVARARRQAERAGVLVEAEQVAFDRLPYDPGSFDVIVVRTRGSLAETGPLATAVAAAGRVLRDGGRCLILGDGPRHGLRALLGSGARGPGGDALVEVLSAAGYRGARVLAEREGLLFVEGVHRQA